MLPAATVRALTIPAFTAAEFTSTQWATADEKAKFANALMKFIATEFPRQNFTRSLYQRLSNTFGHIAHTNLDGFYSAFFERDADTVVFLEQTLSWPAFRRPDLDLLRRRARGPTPTARREGDRHLPFARGRRHPQARDRDARSPTGEIRSTDAAARSGARWLAAVFARSGRTICLRPDPGQTDRQSRCYW